VSFAALAVALLLGFAATAPAAVFKVDSLGDAGDANVGNGICDTAGGDCTLRAAIEEANDTAAHDTIKIGPKGAITADTDLIINSSMDIVGRGASKTTVQGDGSHRVFTVENAGDVTIAKLTISDGVVRSGGDGGGIFEGPETKVELLLRRPETVTYLSSRRLHPTQKFRKRKDGKTVLSMTVRGTTELKPWVMSMGHYVEVLRPNSLRDELREALTQARRLYR
jgi:CSLREA domain-containing protein